MTRYPHHMPAIASPYDALTKIIVIAALAALLACVLLSGCAGRNAVNGPYSTAGDPPRDPQRARDVHAQAVEIIQRLADDPDPEQLERAEQLIREALNADLYHGPAHNNLGVILLQRDELYDAAREFEWARRLMPGHPDPRVNLALTLERAGKTDEALSAYASALETSPNYLPAIQGRASLQIRTNRHTPETLELLKEIALRSDERWREWAILWKTKLAAH